MRNSFLLMTVYVLVVSVLLALGRNGIASLFGATGDAGELVSFFCLFVSFSFLFNGLLFVSNAAFNNLGFALYSTAFNWGRSVVGVVPLVWLGARYYGAEGALAGYGLSAVIFGLAAAFACLRVIDRIAETRSGGPEGPRIQFPPSANSPFTTGKGAT
jgi:Na+-driven multidrug efflux pump